MKMENEKTRYAECQICGNVTPYDKHNKRKHKVIGSSYIGSSYDINDIEIILCLPCEDDLFKKLAKGRGIPKKYIDGGEVNMELIEDRKEASAYTFCNAISDDEVTRLIDECGSDQDLICAKLNEQYPENKYFVLVDYIDDRNMGYFHIRVWKK